MPSNRLTQVNRHSEIRISKTGIVALYVLNIERSHQWVKTIVVSLEHVGGDKTKTSCPNLGWAIDQPFGKAVGHPGDVIS